MATGKLPFKAPNVAGILMKQITEPAPMVSGSRDDVPEDLGLAISRCLEKDPQNRWPTAESLHRALESRTVTGYQPTGMGWKAATGTEDSRPVRRASRADLARRPSRERTRPGERPRRRSSADRGVARRRKNERTPSRRRSWDDEQHAKDKQLVRDTGEPKIVQRMRAQFAAWASVNGGLFLLNVATGLDGPWFIFPAGIWGIFLLSNYAKVWQAGYSWRDVLRRPPAPGSVEHQLASQQGGKGLPRPGRPSAEDFGAHTETLLQMERDRSAITKQLEGMPESERTLLPDVSKTIDGLYQRGQYLALTLVELENQVNPRELVRVEERMASLDREPDDEERQRRLSLLERQRDSIKALDKRRRKTSRNLESCVLAMQNVRFDLLRLKSANMQEVLGDLTQATQQARALSRDVDNAIDAVGEVGDVLRS